MKRVLFWVFILGLFVSCRENIAPLTPLAPPKEAHPRVFQGAYIIDCPIEGFKSPALRENP